MNNPDLILRFIVSFMILAALIVAFALFLKLLKSKGYKLSNIDKNSKQLRLLEQFYIDSKNKIIKVKDGDKVLTVLIGANAKLINQETYQEPLQEKPKKVKTSKSLKNKGDK